MMFVEQNNLLMYCDYTGIMCFILQIVSKDNCGMQRDQAAQGDGDLAEDNEDYESDCRDPVANLVERFMLRYTPHKP